MPDDVDSKVIFRPAPNRRQIQDRRAQWRGGRRAEDFDSAKRDLAARIIGEYVEQPGLKLTLAEASHLFAIDMPTCSGVLEMLVHRGPFLKTPSAHFVLVPRISQQLRWHGDTVPQNVRGRGKS